MVQSPSWEANWFAASQEIPRISRNPKVHYPTYKFPPPVSILGQPYPVHTPTSHLLEIHPNIIHPSTPRSPEWSISLRFPQQDPIQPSQLIRINEVLMYLDIKSRKQVGVTCLPCSIRQIRDRAKTVPINKFWCFADRASQYNLSNWPT